MSIPDDVFLEAARREDLCAERLVGLIKEGSVEEGGDDQVRTDSRCVEKEFGGWSIWASATAVASLWFFGLDEPPIPCAISAELPPDNTDEDVVVKTVFLDELVRMAQLAEDYWPGSILPHVQAEE